MTEFPEGWAPAPLGQLVVNRDRDRVPINAKERAARQGTVPYYGASGQVGWIDRPLFDEPLLLLGEDGVQFFDAQKQKAYMIDGPAWVNNHAHVLAERTGIQLSYLMHYLNQFDYHGYANGTTRLKLTRASMDEIPVRVAPRAEQERIVTAIEEAFSKLDAGEDGLRTVRQLLKRMRAAVLAAAITGRLIPQDPTDTPAPKLLADLGVELLGSTGLPDGWALAPLGDAVGSNAITDGPFGSNLKTEHYRDAGPRVIRLQNIGVGEFRDEHAHIDPEHFAQLAKHEVRAGDVLVASLGEVLPRACLAPNWLGPAIVKADCIRIRPGNALIGAYLMLLLNSAPIRTTVAASIKGVGRPRVNLGDLRRLPVPVPPLEEQRRIVAEAERQGSFIEACERALEAGLARAGALRRAVLKSAFEGRLVPQDPSDEPASALLERIRAERSANPSGKRRTRRTA